MTDDDEQEIGLMDIFLHCFAPSNISADLRSMIAFTCATVPYPSRLAENRKCVCKAWSHSG